MLFKGVLKEAIKFHLKSYHLSLNRILYSLTVEMHRGRHECACPLATEINGGTGEDSSLLH